MGPMSQGDPSEVGGNQCDVIVDALEKLETLTVVRGCFLMEPKADGTPFEQLPIRAAAGRGVVSHSISSANMLETD